MSNTFTDAEGDVFEAEAANYGGETTIELSVHTSGRQHEDRETIEFFKADAPKIIALIEAAAA